MAAPSSTIRTTPTGFKMPDGYQTLIAFASDPGLQLWEVTVKPPGVDGGEPIQTSTMHNATWRTFDFRKLKTLMDGTAKCAYDPDVYSRIFAICNKNQSCTCRFPDGSTLDFWGGLYKFEPDDHEEGKMPLATCMIKITNWDPVGFVEAGPVFTVAAGT